MCITAMHEQIKIDGGLTTLFELHTKHKYKILRAFFSYTEKAIVIAGSHCNHCFL